MEVLLMVNGRNANPLWISTDNEKQSVDAKLQLLVRILKERVPGYLDV